MSLKSLARSALSAFARSKRSGTRRTAAAPKSGSPKKTAARSVARKVAKKL